MNGGLLSFLIASALSAAVSVMLVSEAREVFAASGKLHAEADAAMAALRIQKIIDGIAHDIDAHTLPLAPVRHTRGRIQLADGSAVRISADYAPLAGSDALSYFSISGACLTRVLSAAQGGGGFEYFACAGSACTRTVSDTRALIGVLADRLLYLEGSSAAVDARPGCFLLQLRQEKNLLLPLQSSAAPLAVRLLLPVQEQYTWYLAKDGTLRRLGLRGSQVIENQPVIAARLGSLSFEVNAPLGEGFSSISSRIRVGALETLSYGAMNRLGRGSLVNLLLN